MLFRQFLADVVSVTLDSNGRFLIPRDMADYCGISREVLFVGVDDRVEMWSREQMEASFLSVPQLAKVMHDMSTRFDADANGASAEAAAQRSVQT